jgi:hypothetical protein
VSFRARLTIAAALAVAIAVAAAAAVAYVVVQNQLRGQVDDSLRTRASAIESMLAQRPDLNIVPTSDPQQFFGRLPSLPFGDGPGYVQLISSEGVLRDPDQSRPRPPGDAQRLQPSPPRGPTRPFATRPSTTTTCAC